MFVLDVGEISEFVLRWKEIWKKERTFERKNVHFKPTELAEYLLKRENLYLKQHSFGKIDVTFGTMWIIN
jgi:hypothetical protein